MPDPLTARFGGLERIHRTAPVGLAVLDRELRFVWINECLARINGASVEAHLGRTVREMVPALTDQVDAIIRRIVETGTPWRDVELVGETPAQPGVVRTWLEQWHPVRDDRDAIVGVSIVVEDITERRRLERENARLLEQARDSESRLRSLVDHMPGIAVFVVDRELRYRYVGGQGLESAGVRPTDFLGRTIFEALSPDVAALHAANYRQALAGHPFVHEHVSHGRHFVSHGRPLRDADGEVREAIAVSFDITERKAVEQALADSERSFRNMADHSPSMVWVTDPTGACTYLNRQWYVFTGQDQAEALGYGWLDATHPDDRAEAERAFRAAHAARGPFLVEYRLRRFDGVYRWAIDSAAPRFDANGDFLGHVGSVIDITERREAEDALREADARKDEFIAMLAHELRNPLAPVRTGLRILERVEPLTERGRDTLAMLERQTRQIQRLVDDLLEVSRISRGQIELRPEIVSVGVLFHNAADAVAHECETRRQTLLVRVPPAPLRIHADPVRLAQVLENLLLNACKYTPDGGEIALQAESLPDAVEIRVVDNGIGIEPDQQARLFELFHQIDPTLDRSSGGLGIGLALVRRLVELHGGTVSVSSAGLGQGSTFTVRLPRGAVRV
ncbi:MAG TPA: PAS domain-containing protein [Burkholderiaceae bacterium]|nr:PAS domain-containing protein [Burkholderiaceae bacterium]